MCKCTVAKMPINVIQYFFPNFSLQSSKFQLLGKFEAIQIRFYNPFHLIFIIIRLTEMQSSRANKQCRESCAVRRNNFLKLKFYSKWFSKLLKAHHFHFRAVHDLHAILSCQQQPGHLLIVESPNCYPSRDPCSAGEQGKWIFLLGAI